MKSGICLTAVSFILAYSLGCSKKGGDETAEGEEASSSTQVTSQQSETDDNETSSGSTDLDSEANSENEEEEPDPTFVVYYTLDVSADDAIASASVTTSWAVETGDDTDLDFWEMAISSDGGDGCDEDDFASADTLGWTKLPSGSSSGGFQIADLMLDGDGNAISLTLDSITSYCSAIRATGTNGATSPISVSDNSWVAKFLAVEDGAYTYPDGNYALNCKAYLDSNHYRSYGDGIYYLDPDDAGGADPFKAYCDMTTDGGGWTLVDNVAQAGETISSRTVGANTDLGVTAGHMLPSYTWSASPQLLCMSSHYSGDEPWVTFDVVASSAGLNYPTSNNIASGGTEGLFTVATLNNNTDQGGQAWIYNSSGRIGTVWIGNGGQPTCACSYTSGYTGLGGYVVANATCSTYVR